MSDLNPSSSEDLEALVVTLIAGPLLRPHCPCASSPPHTALFQCTPHRPLQLPSPSTKPLCTLLIKWSLSWRATASKIVFRVPWSLTSKPPCITNKILAPSRTFQLHLPWLSQLTSYAPTEQNYFQFSENALFSARTSFIWQFPNCLSNLKSISRAHRKAFSEILRQSHTSDSLASSEHLSAFPMQP